MCSGRSPCASDPACVRHGGPATTSSESHEETLRPGTRRPGYLSGKSALAFRTIGEAATELDVKRYVLRFWEPNSTR